MAPGTGARGPAKPALPVAAPALPLLLAGGCGHGQVRRAGAGKPPAGISSGPPAKRPAPLRHPPFPMGPCGHQGGLAASPSDCPGRAEEASRAYLTHKIQPPSPHLLPPIFGQEAGHTVGGGEASDDRGKTHTSHEPGAKGPPWSSPPLPTSPCAQLGNLSLHSHPNG